MIFVIVFIALIILGVLQCYNLFLIHQRTKVLRKVELIGMKRDSKKANDLLRSFPRFNNFITELNFHLIGKNKTMWGKNLVVCIIVQIVVMYINHEFLHLNLFIMMPVSLLITLIGVFVARKKKSRVAFENDFAEALNIINSTVRSGNTIVKGISECGNKLSGDLGEEFSKIGQRLEIGESADSVYSE